MPTTQKGSLTTYEDGTKIFNPYNNDPEKNSPFITLSIVEESKIRATKKCVKVDIKIKRCAFSQISGRTINVLNQLLCQMLSDKRKMKLYELPLSEEEESEVVNETSEVVEVGSWAFHGSAGD